MADHAGTVAFGSDRGGVGKSKAAELRISRHFLQHGRLPVIVEVEAAPRLSLIYGHDNVKLFRIAQDEFVDVEKDPSPLYKVWGQIGDVCMRANGLVVLDIGANLTRIFALWLNEHGEDGPFGTGESLNFFAVTTGHAIAVQSCNQALAYVSQAVPASRRFILINAFDARFPLSSDAPAIKEMVKTHDVRGVLRMPACTSPGLAHVVGKRMRLDNAAAMDVAAWEKACGFPRLEAVLAARRMVSFLDDGIRAFDGASSTPCRLALRPRGPGRPWRLLRRLALGGVLRDGKPVSAQLRRDLQPAFVAPVRRLNALLRSWAATASRASGSPARTAASSASTTPGIASSLPASTLVLPASSSGSGLEP